MTDYYRGSAIWLGIIGWISTYYISCIIKPRFVTPKAFIICWSVVIGLFAVITVNGFINTPFEGYPIHRDVIKTLIPLVVLIWFTKDRSHGLFELENKRSRK